jgi:hypothetical protein
LSHAPVPGSFCTLADLCLCLPASSLFLPRQSLSKGLARRKVRVGSAAQGHLEEAAHKAYEGTEWSVPHGPRRVKPAYLSGSVGGELAGCACSLRRWKGEGARVPGPRHCPCRCPRAGSVSPMAPERGAVRHVHAVHGKGGVSASHTGRRYFHPIGRKVSPGGRV